MAGSVAGTALGCTPCGCLSHVPSPAKSSSPQHLSPHRFLSCSKSALIPSHRSFVTRWWNFTPSILRDNRASLLPAIPCSSCQISWPRSSFAMPIEGEIVGLAVGIYSDFVKDLRTAVSRKHLRTAGRNVRSMSGPSEVVLEETIKRKNSQNAVVVYSKSWCPYCSMVKGLFTDIGVSFELVELDQVVDEQDVQEALRRLTGQSTVPSVFIGGKHIGGCDDTMALHNRGELIPALEATGLKINPP